MKTIQVIFTEKKLKELTEIDKVYYFNTESNINVGDLLKAEEYTTPMRVIFIHLKPYRYYNSKTSSLSFFKKDGYYPIKEIELERNVIRVKLIQE